MAGTGSVYKRGRIWWIRYYHNGERYRESSGSTDKADAERLLRRRLDQIASGGPLPADEKEVTLKDLADRLRRDYKARGLSSIDSVNRCMKHVQRVFTPDTKAIHVGSDELLQYVEMRLDEDAARATIQQELSMLRRAFQLAVDDEQLREVPSFPSLRVDNAREGFLSMADVDAICEEVTEPVAPVVRFAALTGWRKGEIIAYGEGDGLQWREVDFDAGMIRLNASDTKNREGRVFPFAVLPALKDLLIEQRRRTDRVEREKGIIVPHVFHRDGEPIRSIRSTWNGACRRTGLDGHVFHDLRRTAVRNLERAGVSRSVAMKLTGHKTETIYRRYAIADETALREGVEKLADLHDTSDDSDRDIIPMER